MNLFYKMELLRCYRFYNLTLQLFDAILEPITYNMIDMEKVAEKVSRKSKSIKLGFSCKLT